MREPASPLRLEPKSNLVIHANGHNRRRRIRRDHDIQSVRQLRMLDCDFKSIHPLPPVDKTLIFFERPARPDEEREDEVPAPEGAPLCVLCATVAGTHPSSAISSPSRGKILSANRFNASYAWQYSGEYSCSAAMCFATTS